MPETNKTVEEFLAEHGEYAATTSGISMYPLLRDKKYVVKIVPANERLKKYDVALFRRGKQLVLHRVIKVFPDRYFIRGDNCDGGEYVFDSQIVGLLSEINGKDRHVKVEDTSYILYSRFTVYFFPIRYFAKKIYRFVRSVAKRILKGT